ncbi:isochorismatase family protein [Roseovarius sp. S1116L3]|uniref:isochorismatase family protein n=1 Tax=Roseovarius roseus TaxID=3342636 RepID=UPI003726DFBE
MTDFTNADYETRSYGTISVGRGRRPGIVVIDYQKAFTEEQYALGGAPMVMRGLENTARLLKVARAHNIPVANCYTAYKDEDDMPHWKIDVVRREFIHGHPSTELDPRIFEPDYDVKICKTGPSIFFQTPVVPFFTKHSVDTVIVTGCITSGCIRASSIDSFQWGYRTIVPEDCVGDHDEQPHKDNLRDLGRRYADISTCDEMIGYIEEVGRLNS